MALSPKEKKEMNEIASRIRSGMPVTPEEDQRLDELQGRMYADVPPLKAETIFDLPVTASMWEADGRDVER